MNGKFKTIPLGEACTVVSRKPTRFTGERRYFSTGAVGPDGQLSDFELVTFEKRPSRAGCMPQIGDVGVARMKGTKKVVLIDEPLQGSLFSTGMCFLAPRPNLRSRYLFYFLTSDHFQAAKDEAAGKGIMGGIKNADIARIEVMVPPLAEQDRIVAALDQATEVIAIAKANSEDNGQNARSLLESHVQSVFLDGRENGWVKKRLGDICERVSVGHVGPTSEFYCEEDGGIPFLRSQNVRRGHLDWRGIRYVTREFHEKLKKSQLRAGDLLFVRVGANRGDCCALPNDVGEVNCANIVFARPREANAAFLERYCGSSDGRRQLLGMTTGSAQGVINTASVAELVIPMPSLSEQLEIVSALEELERQTHELESIYEGKVAALDLLKKALLRDAFTGQLRAQAA